MINKRILLINTFPIKNAQGGGQKRQAAMVAAYKKQFSQVQYASVFFKDWYKDYEATDIPLPASLTPRVHESPHTADALSGKAIYEDPEVKRKMTELLRAFRPDIIQVEQVFPYLGLKRLLAELGMQPAIVYSSHNVEYPHKREILESVGMDKEQIDAAVQEIEAAELDLAANSKLVIACTQADKEFYQKRGAKHVVLARNGMAPIKTTPPAVQKWEQHFADKGIRRFALFVGAAHPPNWVGFGKMVGENVGFMPFDARIVLAGGIADYFRDTINQEYNPAHLTFWQRVELAERPSDDSLGALLTLADVILLPITEGGGSNLKTAEAILANKKIVATTHAFRSFENLLDLPNITIADSPRDFRNAIRAALDAPLQTRTSAQQARANAVLWEECLKDAVKEVGQL